MEVDQVLHMNSGNGEASYANSSQFQNKAIAMAKHITEEAIRDAYTTLQSKSTVYIADLGCSSGPNAFLEASEMVKAFEKARKIVAGEESPAVEYAVYLNDLPTNDFNAIFRSLPQQQQRFKEEMGGDFGDCFFAGVAGSFYGRLFPANTLHFVHSSISLHWLSQVPKGLEENKGNIRIAASSPPSVIKAYSDQFAKDFTTFLKCRSKELVIGGRMVLYFIGRKFEDQISSYNTPNTWEFLSKVLNDLVKEGKINENKLNSFNVPMYRSSPGELKLLIEKEGSFSIQYLNSFVYELEHDENIEVKDREKVMANSFRAVTESLVASHFGEGFTEEIYNRHKQMIVEKMFELEKVEFFNVISLTKN